MTQSATAPPPARRRPAQPASSAPGPLAASAAVPDRLVKVEDTPALLNRLQVLAVVVCVLFGVLAAVVQVRSWQASGRAADDTEQVVRLQQVESQLLRADALATNGFLVGGIEPADERTEYDQAVTDVLAGITDAAEAQSADRDALTRLGDQVDEYTTGIAQARANNRQQNPVGVAYLAQAGDVLRASDGTGAIAVLDALVAANQQRAADEIDGQHPWWLLGLGVVALAALFVVNRIIARRFHRRINLGLAAAAGVVAVVTIAVGVHAAAKSGQSHDVRDGDFARTVDAAAARTAANDAKAFESLRLINRGSGPTYEPLWKEQSAIVDTRASAATRKLWDAYTTLHAQLVKYDDGGSFFAAKAVSTSGVGGTSTTAALDAFDSAAKAEVTATGAQATDALRRGGALAVVLAALTLLGGLLAAVAATAGINQRRREYS